MSRNYPNLNGDAEPAHNPDKGMRAKCATCGESWPLAGKGGRPAFRSTCPFCGATTGVSVYSRYESEA